MFASLRFFQRFRFAAKVRNEKRIFVLEVFKILQDRLSFVVETVVASPLQITDLH